MSHRPTTTTRIFSLSAKISRTGTLAMQSRVAKSKKSTMKAQAQKAALAAKERKQTVGSQFKNSLHVLMEQMTKAQPVFIRCIKPNSTKSADKFVGDYVEAQLLYTGMLETTKIRREGFAVRPTFAEFVDKYKILALKASMPADKKSAEEILKGSKITGWQIGKTKVFLKYWHLDKFVERLDAMSLKAVHIQRVVRGFLGRRRVARLRLKAKEEAKKVEDLLNTIGSLHISQVQIQNSLSQHDTDNKKKKTEESDFDFPPPPPPIVGVQFNEDVTVVEEESSDETASDGDILEDVPQAQNPNAIYGPEGSRQATVKWFQHTQSVRVRDDASGKFAAWFHGIITRRESERLLKHEPRGCYLIRVSESRFGYSLSFKGDDRCRHYMIDQTAGGKYIIVGEPKVHKTLHDLTEYHRKYQLSNWNGVLTTPCGQEEGQCDYSELLEGSDDYMRSKVYPYLEPQPGGHHRGSYQHLRSGGRSSAAPPSLPQRNYTRDRKSGRPLPPPPGKSSRSKYH